MESLDLLIFSGKCYQRLKAFLLLYFQAFFCYRRKCGTSGKCKKRHVQSRGVSAWRPQRFSGTKENPGSFHLWASISFIFIWNQWVFLLLIVQCTVKLLFNRKFWIISRFFDIHVHSSWYIQASKLAGCYDKLNFSEIFWYNRTETMQFCIYTGISIFIHKPQVMYICLIHVNQYDAKEMSTDLCTKYS